MSDLTPEQARKLHRSEASEPELADPYGGRSDWAAPRCRYCKAFRDEGHEADCPWIEPASRTRATLEELLEVTEAKVLRVTPGDVLLFTTRAPIELEPDETLRLITELEALLPDGVRAVVLSGIELTRVTTDAELEADTELEEALDGQ